MKITKFDLFKIAIRTFFLQSCFNFKMQNFGFLYAITPALQKLYEKKDKKMAFERHLELFNTHPYMASLITGFIVKLEEKKSISGEYDFEEISKMKKTMCSVFAVIGDELFWNVLRPFVAFISLSIFFINFNILLPALVFLILYNIPHLYIRIAGIYKGYELNYDTILDYIKQNRIQNIKKIISILSLFIIGFLIFYVEKITTNSIFNLKKEITAIFFLFFVFGIVFLIKKGITTTKILVILFIVSTILMFIPK